MDNTGSTGNMVNVPAAMREVRAILDLVWISEDQLRGAPYPEPQGAVLTHAREALYALGGTRHARPVVSIRETEADRACYVYASTGGHALVIVKQSKLGVWGDAAIEWPADGTTATERARDFADALLVAAEQRETWAQDTGKPVPGGQGVKA